MKSTLQLLQEVWKTKSGPFLIDDKKEITITDLISRDLSHLSDIRQGDVVALIGEFNSITIATFLSLLDKKVVIVPLTVDTRNLHEYFYSVASVNVVIEGTKVMRNEQIHENQLLEKIRSKNTGGLILFSTGTTGMPKGILHDLDLFMKRFKTPRPSLKTLSFLLFDHIGGLNTLLHTLFNGGCVVTPRSRSVEDVLDSCSTYKVELLPTTPTFLRMMLLSGIVPDAVPDSLKLITYGTERMDENTLVELCRLLPKIDFRQTYGMSELGILRVKSEFRESLYMKIGGEGIETRVVEGVLQIKSSSKMVGYLNSPSPFLEGGWYDTKDLVDVKGEYIKIIGRIGDVINVGGLKFLPSEIEKVAMLYPNIKFAKAIGRANPITGQHVELTIQPEEGEVIEKSSLFDFLSQNLQKHMVPKRILIDQVKINHRYKQE